MFDQFDYTALDDLEALLADKPRNERWDLIGGCVVKTMVGAGSGPLGPAATSIDDPVVLMQAMSARGHSRNCSETWRLSRQLPSAAHDVPVERDDVLIDDFDGAADAWASRRPLDGLDALLAVPAIGVAVPLRQISERVFSR